MTNDMIATLIACEAESAPLWSGAYKIPWNDPAFSKRMLREHLSQAHDLASRKRAAIERQAAWIVNAILPPSPGRILDLGCGPGLYAPQMTQTGHRYRGIDFGPASIAYARKHFEEPGLREFVLGDIRETPFDGPHDLVMLLYGECNVFAPHEAAHILAKAFAALKPGGRLLLEVHTFDAAKALGSGASWFAAKEGLFSDAPHLCLTRNQWFERETTSRQVFYTLTGSPPHVAAMSSTVKAWTDAEYVQLLEEAGFREARFEKDWPDGREEFVVVSAVKPK